MITTHSPILDLNCIFHYLIIASIFLDHLTRFAIQLWNELLIASVHLTLTTIQGFGIGDGKPLNLCIISYYGVQDVMNIACFLNDNHS